MSVANHYACFEQHMSGRGKPQNHRKGCSVAVGHTPNTTASPQCRACIHEYQRVYYLKVGHHRRRNANHPHYACSLPPEAHPIKRGVGRDHRTGCVVAQGHTPDTPAGGKGGCRGCAKIINRKFRLKNSWQLSTEEYQELFELQNGKCGICARSQAIYLAVDHDHMTGMRRGLLCKQCNVGLGYFRDDKDVLTAAISYLNRYS